MQEPPDSLLVLGLVQQNKFRVCANVQCSPSRRHRLTPGRDERRHRPFVELVHRSQVPATASVVWVQPSQRPPYIALSFRIKSSITSRLAFAIIWITWRSCPPPILAPPPCTWCDCVALEAPDNAVSVPANADVDQLGRFDDSG